MTSDRLPSRRWFPGLTLTVNINLTINFLPTTPLVTDMRLFYAQSPSINTPHLFHLRHISVIKGAVHETSSK
ncbi:hypothetical protein E2C01_041250 [Portunus trituberculatus]|uniref:Uncharacterized protein n=1 Tax=Portunus trituberculatus TaxID=210409 RepID=A0A5B7FJJ2_PORTR|nr:hypothetical protein [Portunus trituberculatus]